MNCILGGKLVNCVVNTELSPWFMTLSLVLARPVTDDQSGKKITNVENLKKTVEKGMIVT